MYFRHRGRTQNQPKAEGYTLAYRYLQRTRPSFQMVRETVNLAMISPRSSHSVTSAPEPLSKTLLSGPGQIGKSGLGTSSNVPWHTP